MRNVEGRRSDRCAAVAVPHALLYLFVHTVVVGALVTVVLTI